MSRRVLTWSLALPLVAASVMLGHAAAYALTGTPLGDTHGYLHDWPQLAVVLGTLGVLGLSIQQRGSELGSPWPYVLVAGTAFAGVEHLERLGHGDPALLVTDRTFLVGLLLQLPAAAVCLVLARWIARSSRTARTRSPRALALLPLDTDDRLPAARPARTRGAPRGRSPPALAG